MPKLKIAITMSKDLLEEIDRLVAEGISPNRSQAVERAVGDFLSRRRKSRLLAECRKLDPAAESELAEGRFAGDASSWPEY
jgi:metal-responsive CopG/Arc/MetJ family transcriptional regulator